MAGGIVLIQCTDLARIKKRHLRTYPQPRPRQRGAKELERRIKEWDSAVGTLNPEVALKITSKVVQAIMARWSVLPFKTNSGRF